MRGLMPFRAPIAEDVFLLCDVIGPIQESRSSVKTNDLWTLQIVWLSNWMLISLQFSARNFWRRANARPDEGLTLETSAFESLYDGQFTLLTQLIKPNYHLKYNVSMPRSINLSETIFVYGLISCATDVSHPTNWILNSRLSVVDRKACFSMSRRTPHIHSPTCSEHMALQLVFKTAVHYIKQWLSSKCWPQRAFNHIGTKKSRRLEYLKLLPT